VHGGIVGSKGLGGGRRDDSGVQRAGHSLTDLRGTVREFVLFIERAVGDHWGMTGAQVHVFCPSCLDKDFWPQKQRVPLAGGVQSGTVHCISVGAAEDGRSN
jgi:hypothetical protein